MAIRPNSKLNPKKRYLQIALNSTLDEAYRVINDLPVSDRIIIEAGTPLIKRYGENGILQIKTWYEQRILLGSLGGFSAPKTDNKESNFLKIAKYLISQINSQIAKEEQEEKAVSSIVPYIVADLKTMDRAEAEVKMAARAGASGAIALGTAPIETLNSFIAECGKNGIDAMIDMMNVEFPLSVLRSLKKVPPVVILHRGVDEEKFNKEKLIPLHEIRRIKGNYNIMIAIAGGDTAREVQSSVFNDADIVVVWKSVFEKSGQTNEIINKFLKTIK